MVNAFQGRESRIIITDMVAARDNLEYQPRVDMADAELDEADTGGEDYVKVGAITAHVRSPNRLNVALTRGKDATWVVCQAALLASIARPKRGKLVNSISNMITDTQDCNYILTNVHEDNHPEIISDREKLNLHQIEQRRRKQAQNDLKFIPVGRS